METLDMDGRKISKWNLNKYGVIRMWVGEPVTGCYEH
jgi:hypothetical protein